VLGKGQEYLDDVGNPPCLVFGKQLGGGSPRRLTFVVDIVQRLTVGTALK